jgi:hypothetical protein
VTTRAEVAARLGPAVAEFEVGRVWVFVFQATKSGGVRQCVPGDAMIVGQPADFTAPELRYDLVLTFGADDRLARHTLVEKPEMSLP